MNELNSWTTGCTSFACEPDGTRSMMRFDTRLTVGVVAFRPVTVERGITSLRIVIFSSLLIPFDCPF